MKQTQKLNNLHFLWKREWQLGCLSFFLSPIIQNWSVILNNITLSTYFSPHELLMSF